MSPPDTEFDPDDNFAHAFGTPLHTDEDDALETLVWQLLLLVNPGDEDAAMQQFAAWQERFAESGDAGDTGDAVEALCEVIDWRSGFRVDESDAAGLVEVIDELAARWNLRIDWGVEDASDTEFLDEAEVPALIGVAFDRLRERHYTLWTWDTDAGGHAGFITHSRDDDAMRVIAPALGIPLRPGAA
jgi:hypothetical protein